jgi:hypothetical protein
MPTMADRFAVLHEDLHDPHSDYAGFMSQYRHVVDVVLATDYDALRKSSVGREAQTVAALRRLGDRVDIACHEAEADTVIAVSPLPGQLERAEQRVRDLRAALIRLLPAGIESACDECGGSFGVCLTANPECAIRLGRETLEATAL